MRVIGIGNALLDVLQRLESEAPLSRIGIKKGAMDLIDESTMRLIQREQGSLERIDAPGGSGCNTMRALSNLGCPAGYIGKIGSDAAGVFYAEAVRSSGVEPYFIHTEGITGCSTILISPDGERTMATFLGPAAELTSLELPDEWLSPYDHIYMEGYLITNADLFEPLLQRVASLGIRVVLDLSNFNIVNGYLGLLKEVIPRYVDILFANESEASAYTGLSAEAALVELMGEVSIAVITLGSRGALVGSGGRTFVIPAGDNAPIDTTGAGDHFAAGFLYGLSRGSDLESAGRIGTLLADHVVGIVGAQISELDWDQIRLKVSKVV